MFIIIYCESIENAFTSKLQICNKTKNVLQNTVLHSSLKIKNDSFKNLIKFKKI